MTTKQDVTQVLLDAVTEMCVGCAADGDVPGCMGDDCSLFTVRMGVPPPRKRHGWLIKVIRARCLSCMGDQAREVLCCESHSCALFPWREGIGIPSRPDAREGIDALLFGDRDPDELTVTDIIFGED